MSDETKPAEIQETRTLSTNEEGAAVETDTTVTPPEGEEPAEGDGEDESDGPSEEDGA